MKRIFVYIISALCLLANNARSTIPVIDYSNLANNIMIYVKEAASYLQQVQTTINTNTTALNEIKQVANEITMLERYGDPATIKFMVGMQDIQAIAGIYQQAIKDFEDLKTITSPAGIEANVQQILNQYQLPSLNGSGGSNNPLQSLFQFSTSNYQTAQTAQAQIQALMEQKKILTAQRDTNISALQTATDSSAVAKYHAAITALSASIADINAQIQQVTEQGKWAQSQNQSAREVSQASQTVQTAAAFSNDVGTSLNELNTLSQGYGDAPHWPSN
jgi:hypothetical protein